MCILLAFANLLFFLYSHHYEPPAGSAIAAITGDQGQDAVLCIDLNACVIHGCLNGALDETQEAIIAGERSGRTDSEYLRDEGKMKNKFEHISNSQLSTLINEWVKNERNRKLLKRRLIDGITLEKIAEEFDISVTRTRQIIAETENLLKSAENKI